jgi:hypothetical protein
MPENYQRQLLLFGWLPRVSVSMFVRDQCVSEEREREREILERWQRASLAFTGKPGRLFETIGIQPVDPKYDDRLKAIRDDSRFGHTFNQFPSEFQLVEIDKLIACQTTVTLDYIEKLIQGFPKDLNTETLIEICLSLDKTVPEAAEMRINENSIIYSSENTDFRFLGVIQKALEKSDLEASSPGGIPTRGLLLLFGYGGSPINALRVGNRVFLNNGFHRVAE